MPPDRGDCRFPAHFRLRSRAEFQRVRENGITLRGHFVTMGFLADASLPSVRLGVITSRRTGGAVLRSRVRRRMREIFRTTRATFTGRGDVVLIPRAAAATAPFERVRAELLNFWRKAGLLPAAA